jgi:hypothetical protein
MNSIFDIEEKSNKEVDKNYLINNGWKLTYTQAFGEVYVKTIHQKNRPARFIRFYYHHDTITTPKLRNMNNWEMVDVYNISDLEIVVDKWIDDWEKNITSATPFLEYYNVQIF